MEKAKSVACFIYDGSEKYSTMTLSAIKSFLANSPGINAGILIPSDLRQEPHLQLTRELAEWKHRLDIRHFKEHFTNWNPTQHKLDIQQYSDTYEYVLWVDSDTITYADVNEMVRTFAAGSALVGLVEDLVTSKPHFRQRWTAATGSNVPRPFVPQTALMIFKRAAFARLFGQWESIWRKWIEPAPFAYYGDPDPAFHGSAFCIEQYALGLALEQLNMLEDGSLWRIPRRQIIFKDVGANGAVGAGGAFRVPYSSLFSTAAAGPHATSHNGSYQLGSSQLGATSYSLTSYQAPVGSYQLGSYQLSGGSYQLGSYQLGSGQFGGSYQLGSYQHQLGSYQLGSSQFGNTSYQTQLSSYQLGSYQLGSSQLSGGSYQLGSYQLGSYQAGGSYQLGSYQAGSYQLGSYQAGSYQLGSYQAGSYQLGAHALAESLKLNEALENAGLIGVVNVNSGLHYDIVVDSFAGSLLHFYSFNYEPGSRVYNQNADRIKETLGQIWK